MGHTNLIGQTKCPQPQTNVPHARYNRTSMLHSGLHLARRVEAAEAAIARHSAEAQQDAALLEVAGGLAVFAGAESPLTYAAGIGLYGPVHRSEVDRMEAFYHTRGALPAVDLCPLADPGLIDILADRGYRPTEFHNLLVKPLLGAEIHPASRSREISAGEGELWCRVVGRGFFEHMELTGEEMDVGRAIVSMPGAHCFLAVSETGEAAGGGALSLRDGLAVLFADGIVESCRRRGLHRDLILARLGVARARGCDFATASAAPGSASQRNYERSGFQVAYTKVLLRPQK